MSNPFTDVVLALVRQDMPDLSLRQCAVLIAVAQAEPGKRIEVTTVRRLAERLNVSKPAITRAFDRLVELGLGKRVTDPADRRSVFFVPTPAGTSMARDQMGVQVA
jgi:DNA-binding MarR family transcriptional regulator